VTKPRWERVGKRLEEGREMAIQKKGGSPSKKKKLGLRDQEGDLGAELDSQTRTAPQQQSKKSRSKGGGRG